MREDTATVSVGKIPLFTQEEFQHTVQSLKNNKAADPDGISSEIFEKLLLKISNSVQDED